MTGVIFLKLLELLQLCSNYHQDKFYYIIFLRMKSGTHNEVFFETISAYLKGLVVFLTVLVHLESELFEQMDHSSLLWVRYRSHKCSINEEPIQDPDNFSENLPLSTSVIKEFSLILLKAFLEYMKAQQATSLAEEPSHNLLHKPRFCRCHILNNSKYVTWFALYNIVMLVCCGIG